MVGPCGEEQLHHSSVTVLKVFNCFSTVKNCYSVKLFCIALHRCTLYCLGLLYFSHSELLLLWTAHPSTALSIEQCNLILCSALTCTALSRASLQGRTKLSPITTQECALRHRSPCNTMQLFKELCRAVSICALQCGVWSKAGKCVRAVYYVQPEANISSRLKQWKIPAGYFWGDGADSLELKQKLLWILLGMQEFLHLGAQKKHLCVGWFQRFNHWCEIGSRASKNCSAL